MKYTHKKIVIMSVLLILVAIIITLFNSQASYLFSRAVDTVVSTADGPDPRPAVESLDDTSSDNAQMEQDTQIMIESLQKELLQIENDPEKAMEIRRRIQLLKEQLSTPQTTATEGL